MLVQMHCFIMCGQRQKHVLFSLMSFPGCKCLSMLFFSMKKISFIRILPCHVQQLLNLIAITYLEEKGDECALVTDPHVRCWVFVPLFSTVHTVTQKSVNIICTY